MSKILALDFGLKRTGVAISDEKQIFAFGLETIDSTKLMDYLIKIVPKENIGILLIGEPKRMDGTDTHITQNVYLLKESIEKRFPALEIVLHDERFTSKMAFESMLSGGASKKQRQQKGLIDKVSATILLQSYLEETRSN